MFWTRRFLPVRPPIQTHHAGGLQCEFSTLCIAVVALVAPIASANALPPVRAGILQCQGGQNVGFVVGSVTSLECVFQSEGRRPEPYIATVHRYWSRSRLHRADPILLGGECPDRPGGARQSRRQLRWRRRQRVSRNWRRRQFSGRRPAKCLRAATAQRARPDRVERRGRHCQYRARAGAVWARRSSAARSPASPSRLIMRRSLLKEARESGPFLSVRDPGRANGSRECAPE